MKKTSFLTLVLVLALATTVAAQEHKKHPFYLILTGKNFGIYI